MAGADIMRALMCRGDRQATAAASHRRRSQRARGRWSHLFVVTRRFSHREILAGGVGRRQGETSTETRGEVANLCLCVCVCFVCFEVAYQVRRVPRVVGQLHRAVANCVRGDGGVVELARHQGELLTDSTSANLLVDLVRALFRLWVKLGVFKDFPLGRRETLAEVQHPVAELCRRGHPVNTRWIFESYILDNYVVPPALPVGLKPSRFQSRRFAARAGVEDVLHAQQGELVPLERLNRRQEVQLGTRPEMKRF